MTAGLLHPIADLLWNITVVLAYALAAVMLVMIVFVALTSYASGTVGRRRDYDQDTLFPDIDYHPAQVHSLAPQAPPEDTMRRE